MALNFSKLEALGKAADHDPGRQSSLQAGSPSQCALIPPGFTLVRDEETPFDVPFEFFEFGAAYRDIEQFHRDSSPAQNTNEYWAGIVTKAAAISRKHQGSPFIKDMLTAVLNDLERRGKDQYD
jgi:hypothetical protein